MITRNKCKMCGKDTELAWMDLCDRCKRVLDQLNSNPKQTKKIIHKFLKLNEVL